jgi:hypothetical protein
MSKPKNTRKRTTNIIKRKDGRTYSAETFLEEILAEKLQLVLKKMNRDDYRRTVHEYISNPGSSMTLILNFSETKAEAEISVMIPKAKDSSYVDELFHQAGEKNPLPDDSGTLIPPPKR